MILRIPYFLKIPLLFLLAGKTSSLVGPTACIRNGRSSSSSSSSLSPSSLFRLGMGGYYSEPEDISDGMSLLTTRQRHMVFGVSCVEESFVVNSIPITNLVPPLEKKDKDEHHEGIDTSERRQIKVLKYIQNPDRGGVAPVDLRNKSVLEIGASAVSLAAALALGASSVVVCHPDPARLQIWEHGYRFFNIKNTAPSLLLETRKIDDWPNMVSFAKTLPPVDVIFITLEEEASHGTMTFWAPIIEQATRNGSRVIMLVPEEEGGGEQGSVVVADYDGRDDHAGARTYSKLQKCILDIDPAARN